ncbi:MAG TPA: hypothetical protein VKU62_11720 [Thermoanaerobaculia bacterium]|nr:hypothetical protein [Thermoanaerobaculia bacterium]
MKRGIVSAEASDWLEMERHLRFYRNVRRLIGFLAASLAIVFSWLKLKGSELLPAAASLPGGVVIRAALIFWYASWLYGCLADIDQQERVYDSASWNRLVCCGR